MKEKTKRNKEMYDIRTKSKMSFRKLAKAYNMDVGAAYRIIQREQQKVDSCG